MNKDIHYTYVYTLYIAKHVLNNDFSKHVNLCGFCGGNTSRTWCAVSSGSKKKGTLGVFSDCSYKFKFSLASAAKLSKNNPYTNRPEECPKYTLRAFVFTF